MMKIVGGGGAQIDSPSLAFQCVPQRSRVARFESGVSVRGVLQELKPHSRNLTDRIEKANIAVEILQSSRETLGGFVSQKARVADQSSPVA